LKTNFQKNEDKTSEIKDEENTTEKKDLTQEEFEEYIETLPKGWNIWSIRSNSKKCN